MKSLYNILEGILLQESILGDIEHDLDVPDSISYLSAALKKLPFEKTQEWSSTLMYHAKLRDPQKEFKKLWDIVHEGDGEEVKQVEVDFRKQTECTFIALVTTIDSQFIVIGNPAIPECIVIFKQPSNDGKRLLLAAEILAGSKTKIARDFIGNTYTKYLYKFSGITYEFIKSSIV